MKTILFQGDSVTDAERVRSDNRNYGYGYPLLAAAQIGFDCPGEYAIYNRGVSGDRVVDVYARIKADIINLKPDYMSILIGVNDAWHEISYANGVDAEKFEKVYGMLIEEIKEALPNIKIMILEPFCLRGSATENTEENPNRWNMFSTEVPKRAEKAKIIANRYGLLFVPLQKLFDAAAEKTGGEYWLKDGVHPTFAGHELIAREWLRAFEKMK
ncbi:MAG: SGNH/GDSL hydrolase family protein [Clostridia bacterium]|nr:SGNH/GDSL hydrolase family protein [Clostridia bacterium]